MGAEQNFSKDQLIELKRFLTTVSNSNEDTEFDPSQENIVETIISLVKQQQKTSIIEDFEIPYVHPMITVQKWSEELIMIINDLLGEM